MTDTMPNNIWSKEAGNNKLISTKRENSFDKLEKYHHDRVVQALQADNERLRGLLKRANEDAKLHKQYRCTDGDKYLNRVIAGTEQTLKDNALAREVD